jgi:uncharacterized protein DUF5808
MEDEQTSDPGAPPEPQGHFAGIPYDWRKPTRDRIKSRMWNGGDTRLFTPRVFGWGYDVNLYWLAHPGDYLKHRRGH